MPTYEYICQDCHMVMEIQATIAEKERGLTPICPTCGGTRMAQAFGGVTVMGKARGNSGGSACGPQAGPGCCGSGCCG